MPKSSVNASLSSYDDIFSTEESRQEDELDDLLFNNNFPTCYHLPKWKQRLLPKPGELEKYIERA